MMMYSFDERIEELRAEIRSYEFIIESRRVMGGEVGDLYADIKELEEEIESIEDERRLYNSRVGYVD